MDIYMDDMDPLGKNFRLAPDVVSSKKVANDLKIKLAPWFTFIGELVQNTAWMQTRSSAIELINRVSLDLLATAVTSTQTQTSKAFT